MTFELPPDDAWVARGYGQEPIEPGERPAVQAFSAVPTFLGGAEKGWDVHRRYVEVTAADEVIEYLASVSVEVPA